MASPSKEVSMSAEENKAIFLRFVDEIKKGNLGVIDEVCSASFTYYSPSDPDWPRGLEGARKLVARVTSGDLLSTIEDIFAGDDKVAVRWTFRGTYSGEPKPGYIPGERFAAAAISIYRFANGKIEEDWGVDVLWNTGIPWHNGS
jgi:SnoaL-like polyketide cyclase